MGENWNKTIAAVVLAAVAMAAGAGIGMLRRGPPVAASPSTTASPRVAQPAIEVHVAGWVNRPGVVTVPDASIVADAIAAAGGMRPGANVDAVNLAAPVSAGQQIVVPGPDTGGANASSPTGSAGGLISLSMATESELETLPGVGPVLAARIVAHRETHGGFETVEDLLRVAGIGEAKLAALRDLVRP